MAFTWFDTNETKVTTNQWGEDIYGLKATNVFGLAWNYYVGYTKFITGLDLTLDMGMKTEFFFAGTIKIGYANELKSIGNQKTGISAIATSIAETFQALCTSSTRVVTEETVVVESVVEEIEVRESNVSSDSIDRETFYSCTNGTENRWSSALIEESESMSVMSTDIDFVADGDFGVDGAVITLG